jgi:hypothetical protein
MRLKMNQTHKMTNNRWREHDDLYHRGSIIESHQEDLRLILYDHSHDVGFDIWIVDCSQASLIS